MWRSLFVLVVGCTACSPSGSQERTSNNHGTKQPYAGPSARTLRAPYIVPGMSNVDSRGLFMFEFPPENGPLPSFEDLVESHAYFSNEAGDRTSLHVLPVTGKNGEAEPRFQVEAVPPLLGDAWHWIVVERDAELGVEAADPIGDWSAHFFTASALHIVKVSSSLSDPATVDVTFSEPVDLTSQLEPSELVNVGGKPAADCFLADGVCGDVSYPVDNTLPVQLSLPFSPSDMLFMLDGSIMGSGRRVWEGASAMGMPLANGRLELSVASSAWTSCPGGTTCWRELRPLPVQ